ncbi:hypothetical protein V6N13_014890 [Hibiscus sabdariffa]|uniref:DUF7903 domain-containing protein n=1 Tax=Hibiscus sabdariffa TaxID=183260 RepID=A0ABR2RXK1_9ROSI
MSTSANIISEVALKIGVDFADVKDSYLVKIELSPVRDMVTDISCMDMDLDLRLGLTHKRILSSLPGESSDEVVLKLKGVASGLLAQDVEANAIADMLEENMSLLWRHFLRCEPFLT